MEDLQNMDAARKRRKLAEAPSSDDSPVQAWAFLHGSKGASQASPTDAKIITHDVLRRLKETMGQEAEDLQVLPNLGAFIVSAKPSFIRELRRQPEIKSVKSTDVPEMTLIRPVKSKEVALPTKAKATRSRQFRKAGAKKK